MPGRRLSDVRPGDRAEYMAIYILSSFAQVVPVPRQEDYGLDFFCALTREENHSLFVEDVFGVQAKKHTKGKKIEIIYGGKDKKKIWKKHEIKWLLFGPYFPLLIALVDIDNNILSLYSTANMWKARWMAGHPYQVKLIPQTTSRQQNLSITNQSPTKLPKGNAGDCKVWEIPLGPPIATLPVKYCNDTNKVKDIYSALKCWLELDQQNVVHQKLGVPACNRFMSWMPNQIPDKSKVESGLFGHPRKGMNVNGILNIISPMIQALAYNYKLQNNKKDLKSLKGILGLLEQKGLLMDEVKKWLV